MPHTQTDHPERRIMIIAGETSGDHHGAKLVESLRYQHKHLDFFGMGGDELRKAGVNTLIDSHDMAVVGFVEVLKIIKKIRRAFKALKQALIDQKPDLLILIDYPGFNLRMAKFAKQHGIKVLYYISPQLWAWHKSRVKIIQNTVDQMAVILPFEVDFYQAHQVKAQYVGHPLLQDLDQLPSKRTARQILDINDQQTVILLAPGSRRSEIHYLLPTLKACAKQLSNHYSDSVFVIPQAPGIDASFYGTLPNNVRLSNEDFYTVIQASDVAVAASGTATLQIALTQTPMVIVYKGHWLSYHIAKRLVTIPLIGLCNLIVDKQIARELIQGDATPQKICAEVTRILEDKHYRGTMRSAFREMTDKLLLPSDQPTIDQLVESLLESH